MDNIEYMLDKQLPSINDEMIIDSGYGKIIIDDVDMIEQIKSFIEQSYKPPKENNIKTPFGSIHDELAEGGSLSDFGKDGFQAFK
ncbi:MAG: hypothetical protein KZQ83_13365 [gamma proteobacterium symbiont of Taylorina sp.]|nr:hypothetical protein [gamma proteobacterium symbiont of Taylorina sp.]